MADISRTDIEGLLVDQNVNEILQDAVSSSAALRTFRTLRMGTKIAKMPILTALPTAQWLDSDTDTKPTADQKWEKKTITAEELAVIVPIPDNVFDDSSFNVWNEVRPRVAEAFGKALDQAVFFGTGAPASFDDSLYEGSVAATQTVALGDSVDLAGDVNETWRLVENVGRDVNVQYASRRIRADLRGLRDDNNQPIYLESLRSDRADRTLMGEDIEFVTNGAWDSSLATMIVGDRTSAILGIRQDVEMDLSNQATLTDGAGNVIFSLFEQDMTALRAKFRVGFVVADTITAETGAREWPFATLLGTGS